MNERIRELMIQSSMVSEVVGNPNGLWTTKMSVKTAEKFAELIVRECIVKITTYDLVPGHSAKWEDIYDIHTRLLQDLGEELKEHFGVTK